jgi:hypothetical protein
VSDGEVEANYSIFDNSLVESTMAECDLLESDDITSSTIENLKVSETLKMYASLLYDIDFFIANYPVGDGPTSALLQKSVDLPFMKDLDTESLNFLSGSNLAFDPTERALSSFSWYDNTATTLNLEIDFGTDVTAFSVWEYLSAIGAVADTSIISDRLTLGSQFENIILLPFDPSDFEVEKETEGDDAAAENIANSQLTAAQEDVGIGLETSQGVEMATFRVTIGIPEEASGSDDE